MQIFTTYGVLLHALSRRPSYGTEIIEEVWKRSGRRIWLCQGSVYPALKSLEVDGLVRCETRVEGPGRPRRYYLLTEAGVLAASENRAAIAALFMMKDPARPGPPDSSSPQKPTPPTPRRKSRPPRY